MVDPKGSVGPYKTAEEIAKKHKVPLDHIIKQVKLGTKVEFEHTTSKKVAEITALQHLDELPDYYSRLKKMEKKKSPVKESVDNNKEMLAGKRYCLLCNKHETEPECSWGPAMWRKYSISSIHPANEEVVYEDHKEVASGKKKDEEGYMARVEFDQIDRSVAILRKLITKGNQQLPAWVQSKITRAADFIDTAAEYMQSDETVSEGFIDPEHGESPSGRSPLENVSDHPNPKVRKKAVKAFKKQMGKEYGGKWKSRGDDPTNEDTCLSFSKFMQIAEVAAWQRKEGKNKEGGLNEKGRKSYENENPGSDLKAPSKKVGNPRRSSFCARMSGMKKKLTSKKTANDPNSRINKSLRAWNC